MVIVNSQVKEVNKKADQPLLLFQKMHVASSQGDQISSQHPAGISGISQVEDHVVESLSSNVASPVRKHITHLTGIVKPVIRRTSDDGGLIQVFVLNT